MKPGEILCPSASAQRGSKLLGLRQANGSIAILPQPLRLSEEFLAKAAEQGPAERRFRFTNKCVESGCKQWNGSRCSVADKVLAVSDELPVKEKLPACAIRPQCRWFLQSGADACKICEFVITQTTAEEWELKAQEMIAPLVSNPK